MFLTSGVQGHICVSSLRYCFYCITILKVKGMGQSFGEETGCTKSYRLYLRNILRNENGRR